jgi:hypothetical protein
MPNKTTNKPGAKKLTVKQIATKPPTDLHIRYQAWLKAQGVEVDLKAIQIICATRDGFQASPENQAAIAQQRAEAASARTKVEAERIAKAEQRLAQLKARAGVGAAQS